MLKGKQKNLDKNKDGKITGEDFKMMKAKYGKMMKAKKGVMAKSSTGKMEEDKYSKYVRSIKLPEPGDIFKEMKTPYLKPKGKSMGGEMIKARYGTMLKNKEEAKKKKIKELRDNKGGVMEEFKISQMNMGGEMKSTQGYGAARTSGMGLQDEDLIPGKSMDYYKDLM